MGPALWLTAWAWSPIAVTLAGWSAVGVVAVPPDTLCPSRADVAAALVVRLPDEITGWVARYRVEARAEPPVDNRLRFELYDDRGRLRLRRELSIADDACAAAAQGLALILERYFEEVSWTASVPLPEIERAAEPAPPGRRWELQVGVAGRREIALQPALALDVRAALSPAWLAAAGLVLQPAASSQRVGFAVVELRGLPLRLSLRRTAALRRLRFDAGPALTLTAESGTASPGLAGSSGYRLASAVGLVASARWPLSLDWTAVLEAGADLTLLAPAFVVDGVGEVLAPRRIQLLGLLGISRTVSR